MGFSKFMKKKGGTRRCRGTTSSTKIYNEIWVFTLIKVDLPPPVDFSICTTRFPYKTYGVRKRNLGKSSINRQIQKYVANHNKDGPKTKLKMKKFLTALSSVLYFMFYFPPYVLYGKRVVHFEKWTGGGKSTLVTVVLLEIKLKCEKIHFWNSPSHIYYIICSRYKDPEWPDNPTTYLFIPRRYPPNDPQR